MKHEPEFEQIREEIEAKQRSVIWPDTMSAGKNVDEFLWNGDPKAKPIQRAGLIIFGAMFLFPGLGFIFLLFKDDVWGLKIVFTLIGITALYTSCRLFRNAFLRPRNSHRYKPK